ncbi:hypothetical protein EVAR_28009_1 [Eumeta japonica]|uniref:Uncharacterized protein n=1 Tax=Eumeta variegata TaxID=151549 RepID=A0A4C1WC41_EUMVA|nr:hypothetical protein EVAR_28009_1 [Eumeta japonica]
MADAAVVVGRESNIGVFTTLEAVGGCARWASLKEEKGRPSLSASEISMPVNPSGCTPWLESQDSPSYQMNAHPIGSGEANYENFDREPKQDPQNRKQIRQDGAAISSTRTLLGHFDGPEELANPRTVKAKPALHPLNYIEAAAKPKPLTTAA